LEKLWRLKYKITILFMLWLILSGCLAGDSTMQPTLMPITVAPNQMALALPINATATRMAVALPIVQTAPEETLTPRVDSIPPQTPMPVSPPGEAQTDQSKPQITLLFTGVIVPARCVQSAIDARGDANYLYDEVRELISSADLAVGTLNTSLSDLSTHTGCIETYVLVSDSRSAEAASSAGFDVMSVATNHIKNCSGASCRDYFNRAFNDTLDNLRANAILPVGAGENLEEAMRPVVVEVQGIRFGFVSLGMIEPTTFAGQDSPGIAELNDENLHSAIDAARQVSDVVIAMPHWGPEDTSDPDSNQLNFARVAVEAGADVVVGNHTHVVQAIQQLNGVDVFYGLGNFIFDQTWDLAHQQGVMLILHFDGTDYTGYDIIPTHVDGDGTVHIADLDEAGQIIQRIEQASEKLR
jgi:poly-gamma-glutamate capsule biosynthesis protein CapA/YwtB (metallophosphatase superfamily)